MRPCLVPMFSQLILAVAKTLLSSYQLPISTLKRHCFKAMLQGNAWSLPYGELFSLKFVSIKKKIKVQLEASLQGLTYSTYTTTRHVYPKLCNHLYENLTKCLEQTKLLHRFKILNWFLMGLQCGQMCFHSLPTPSTLTNISCIRGSICSPDICNHCNHH